MAVTYGRKLVYLGGGINGLSDEGAKGWRNRVKPILENKGYLAVDPMIRDYRGREDEEGVATEIVESDMNDLKQSDVFLFNAIRPSWGTAMEILIARQLSRQYSPWRKSIVVVPPGTSVSPWVRYHADEVFFGTPEQAVEELL